MNDSLQIIRDMGNYDDIIDLPHHVSPVRTPMSLYARAAQFAPFAALGSHDPSAREIE